MSGVKQIKSKRRRNSSAERAVPAGSCAAIEITTAFGVYAAELTARGVRRLYFPGQSPGATATPPPGLAQLAARLRRELAAYHLGERGGFTVPLDLSGHTAFRRNIWELLQKIPYGEVVTYGGLARRAGCRSARAAGQACGANPLPVLIPCHRIVAAGGKPGGWSGAPGFKEKLLALEQARPRRAQPDKTC